MTASPPERSPGGVRLADRIAAALPEAGAPALIGPASSLPLHALATHSFIDAPPGALSGHSVLIRTRSPLAAAAALASLDGVASRVVLCPPDLDASALPSVVEAAEAGAIASDVADDGLALPRHAIRLDPVRPSGPRRADPLVTLWALFTSGTSGTPKMVAHTLDGLTGAIAPPAADAQRPVWATFYDIRRYGGLQMLLRALTGGFSLHVAEAAEPLGDFLTRLRLNGVTHIAGTPSHWRSVLMSPALAGLDPAYVRLSGEIADRAVLEALRARFPRAVIVHAYASTEAGVGFEVGDGLEGFPARLVDEGGPVGVRVVDGALHLRSPRAASAYLGRSAPPLGDAQGWVDTGDLVERRGERFHFLGRRSGVINVGGIKISPEEVEAVLNACPGVRMSRVTGRANPLLGALVSAEVVLDAPGDPVVARSEILAFCRAALPPHKTPASIRFVEALKLGAAGKLERRLA